MAVLTDLLRCIASALVTTESEKKINRKFMARNKPPFCGIEKSLLFNNKK